MQRCVMRDAGSRDGACSPVRDGSRTARIAAFAVGLVTLLSLGAPRSLVPSHGVLFTTLAQARTPGPASSASSAASAAPATSASPGAAQASCPAGTLPDGDVCVRLPDATGRDEGAATPESVNTHRDSLGRWVVYEEIPRRPDRPADYGAYRYPVPCGAEDDGGAQSDPRAPARAATRGQCVVSGYDLDRSDEEQRRAPRLRDVGHGAVDLPERRGTPVVLLSLEHQEGNAEVVYVGPLFGTTVVTRHTVREAGHLRDYLLLFGHLDAAAPGLSAGSAVREGDVVGLVGDSGSPGLVHLHLEVRRLRDGVDVTKLAPSSLVDGAESIVCDPRNVLPLLASR
jgi:murein DD-endopeptidase MepM/ murein hydrolase activator NlpD